MGKTNSMNLKGALQLLGGIAVVLTLFPLIAADYWWIRVFDFPHLQLSFLTLAAFLFYFIRFDFRFINDYIFVAILLACLGYQFSKIYPYTFLAPVEVMQANPFPGNRSLRLLTTNVLQKNRNYSGLISETERFDPDIVLLTEVNRRWQEEIAGAMRKHYEYLVSVPRENTYGMLLYSRFPLKNDTVLHLVDKRVPAIYTEVLHPSAGRIALFGIHPTPPLPQHNPTSTDRDAAMMKVALRSLASTMPLIVMGDFNDVAWSQTTKLFQEVSSLRDPRKGRGLFNTYHAQYPFLRWPLDHLFISDSFRLMRMEVGADVGSDHFPVFCELLYQPQASGTQERKAPSGEAMKKANSIIQSEQKADSRKQKEGG